MLKEVSISGESVFWKTVNSSEKKIESIIGIWKLCVYQKLSLTNCHIAIGLALSFEMLVSLFALTQNIYKFRSYK